MSSELLILFLAKLSSLEILLLEHNRLTTLPDLSVLENLTELNLFANKLSAMPDLSNLKKLTRLDLELNSLKESIVLSSLFPFSIRLIPHITPSWCMGRTSWESQYRHER